jgi:hypothetical protein
MTSNDSNVTVVDWNLPVIIFSVVAVRTYDERVKNWDDEQSIPTIGGVIQFFLLAVLRVGTLVTKSAA